MEQALLANQPAASLEKLQRQGVLFILVPELAECWGFQQHHPQHEQDVFHHTLGVVAGTPADLVLRWAALLHDIAKPHTFTRDKQETGHFYHHASLGEVMTVNILKRFQYPEEMTRDVGSLVHYHMSRMDTYTTKGMKRLARKLGKENLQRLVHLFRADIAAHKPPHDYSGVDAFERLMKETLVKHPST